MGTSESQAAKQVPWNNHIGVSQAKDPTIKRATSSMMILHLEAIRLQGCVIRDV